MKVKSSVKRQKGSSFTKLGIGAILGFVLLLCSTLAMPFGKSNTVQNSEESPLGATPKAVTDTNIKFDPANYGYEWGQIKYTRTTANFDTAANPENFYVNGTAISLAKGESTGYYDCLVKRGLQSADRLARDSTFILYVKKKVFTDYYKGYTNVSTNPNVALIQLDMGMSMTLGETYSMLSLSKTNTEEIKIVVQSNGVARIDYSILFDKQWSTTKRYLTETGFQNSETNAVTPKNFSTVPQAKSFTYDGTTKVPFAAGTNYKISGTTSAVNFGSYSTTFTLTSGYWTDGTQTNKTVEWKIEPKLVTLSDVQINGIPINSYNSFKDITPQTNVSTTITGLMGVDALDINAVWAEEPLQSGTRNITLSSSNPNYIISDAEIPVNYYADYFYVGNSKIEENCRVLTNENLTSLINGDKITIVGNPKVTEGMVINSSVTICGEDENSGFDVSVTNIKIGASVIFDSTFKVFNAPSDGGITLIKGGKLDITAYLGDILNIKADSSVALGDALLIGDKTKINLTADKSDEEIRFGYEKMAGELLLGGLKITGTSVSEHGKIMINGSIIGDNTKLNVVISDFNGGNEKNVTSSAIFNEDGSFVVNSDEIFNSGKKIVTLTYIVGDYKLSSSTLVTIPVREEGSLNGKIDFGDLDGDTIWYEDKDGNIKELPVKDGGKATLPDDIVVDSNGNVVIFIKDKNTDKKTDVTINVGGGRVEKANNFDKSYIVIRDTTLTLKTEVGFEYCVEDMNGNIIAGCDWTSGTSGELVFTVLENTEYIVKARAKGSENQQPGISTVVEVKTKSTAVQNAQDEAKTALDTAAQTVKDEIDGLMGLTQEEKDALKTAIDTAASEGKKDIELKDTVETVHKVVEDTKIEFNKIVEETKALLAAKDAAKDAMDTAAQIAKDAIDAMNGLSDIDKKNYKDEVDNSVKATKDTITNAKNMEEVTTIQNDGTAIINTIVLAATALDNNKVEAINLINERFEADKKKINDFTSVGNTNDLVTQEAKNKVIGLLEEKRDAAILAVSGCKTSADVEIAKEEGLLNLARCEASGEIGFSQEYWNGRLQDYVDGANKKLTQVEADGFKSFNNKWYAAAVATIASTSGDFETSVKYYNNEMYKESVISDIFYEKKLAIEEANKLDDSNLKKAQLIDEIEKAYSLAQTNMLAIDANDFNNLVINVRTISLKERLSINKWQAKAEIELNMQEALKRTDKLKEPFKEQEKAKINAAYGVAMVRVDGATQVDVHNTDNTPKKIADIQQMIIDKLGYGAQLLAAKNDACSRLDSYLSTDNAVKVAAAKAEITREYEKALGDVESAVDTESTILSMQNGEKAINKIVYAFAVANTGDIVGKIETDANIILDSLTHLTEEQKLAVKDAINNAIQTAKDSITSATTLDEIDAAEQVLKDTVAAILLGAQKEDAKNDLDNFVTAEKEKMDALGNLTENEKLIAKNALDTQVTELKNKIDEAAKTADIAIELENGKNLIEIETAKAVAQDLVNAKTIAKNDLDNFVNAEKEKIDGLNNLSDAEKTIAKSAIDAFSNAGKEEIDKLTTGADIKPQMDLVKNLIEQKMIDVKNLDAKNLSDAKIAAKDDLDNFVNAEKEKMDALGNLTEDEKSIAKNAINTQVTELKNKIDEAAKTADVATELENGKNSIEAETAKAVAQDLVNKKIAAKNVIDNLVIAEKEKIDGLNNLSDAEKALAKSAIDAFSNAGKEEIDKLTTGADIKPQMDLVINLIEQEMINVKNLDAKNLSDAKIAAKDDLDNFVNAEKEKMDALGNLTEDEKLIAKSAIDTELTKSKDKMDEVTKTVDVATELENGKNLIEAETAKAVAQDLVNAKTRAKNDLDNFVNAEKEKIDALVNLTEDEKLIVNNTLDTQVTKLKNKMDEAAKTADVAIELENGKNSIEAETAKAVAQDLVNKKIAAKNAIDNLLIAEKEKIDGLNNLSDAEKTIAKSAIDNVVAANKDKIDQATTAQEVEAQKDTAITSIKEVTIAVAKKVVQDYAKEVKTAISNSSLTSAEKQFANDEIDVLIKNANDEIDKAQDSAGFNQAVTSGMDKIFDTYQSVVEKEFDKFLKDYVSDGKYADDYDDMGKTAIDVVKQSGKAMIESATSIKDLQDELKIAKDKVVDVLLKAPIAMIDCVNEQLNGLEPNKLYTINDGTNDYIVTANSNGSIALIGKDSNKNNYDFSGKMLTITKNGIIEIQAASKPQMIEVPARAVTPDPKIDYIDKIVNLGKPNTDFTVTVDGKENIVTTNNNGEIILQDKWIGKTISFMENSDGENALGSLPKEIVIQKYWTLTFNYNDKGATADKRYSVNDGQTVPIQTEPNRSGYVFLGWFKDYACTVEWNFKYNTVNENTVIYAGWQAEHSGVNTVTVTFVAEGKPNEIKIIDKNTTIKSQNVTAPNGKTFAGWYTDPDFKYKYDFKNKVTENITFYAKFVTSKIIVTLPNGKKTELNYGDKLERPIDPTKDGYVFAGWYTDKGCNDALLFADDKTKDGITQNITLYPKWVQETHTITGTVTDKDGNPVANTDITIEIQPVGKTITTDDYGKFTITGVSDGNYRIVVKYEKGGFITVVTEAIRVSGANVTLPNISIIGENLNSKVEIGENAPDVVVSGLNDLFKSDKHVSEAEKQKAKLSGNNAELKFVVTDSGKNKLLNDYALENKKQIGFYLDFTLFKIMTVNGIVSTSYLSNLDSILKVIVPLGADMQGKTNYTIYRIHDGEMQEIKIGLENANKDGEYMELSLDGKYLSVYTKNFSSYAIAFDEQVSGVGNSCFTHWIVLSLILTFVILIALFTSIFTKKCLVNIITWGVYIVGLFVLMFFVWSCAADIMLWIVGVMLAIMTALFYFFVDENKEKEQVHEVNGL